MLLDEEQALLKSRHQSIDLRSRAQRSPGSQSSSNLQKSRQKVKIKPKFTSFNDDQPITLQNTPQKIAALILISLPNITMKLGIFIINSITLFYVAKM